MNEKYESHLPHKSPLGRFLNVLLSGLGGAGVKPPEVDAAIPASAETESKTYISKDAFDLFAAQHDVSNTMATKSWDALGRVFWAKVYQGKQTPINFKEFWAGPAAIDRDDFAQSVDGLELESLRDLVGAIDRTLDGRASSEYWLTNLVGQNVGMKTVNFWREVVTETLSPIDTTH